MWKRRAADTAPLAIFTLEIRDGPHGSRPCQVARSRPRSCRHAESSGVGGVLGYNPPLLTTPCSCLKPKTFRVFAAIANCFAI